MAKSIVLQFHRRFFATTETFIYNYIVKLSRVQPLCYARRYINLSDFPIESKKIFTPHICPSNLCSRAGQFILKTSSINLLPLKCLDKTPIKLIHAHFGPQGVAALKLKARWGGPLCTTFYGYDASLRPQQKKWIKLYKKLFENGDLFLVEGAFMKQRLIDIGCPEKKIKIQRIAIPLEKISFRPRYPKNLRNKVNIVFCATFVEKKGHIHALNAVKLARKQNKNFVLHIYGSGILRNSIIKFINSHNLNEYVHLHEGLLTYSEYLNIMNKADIFIHPSITAKNGDTEGGAPTTILEAQAMGIPVVSTFHADIPNIVVPGESALLSPEKDDKLLAKNLLLLLENQLCWKKMGEIGRDFVEKWHNVNNEVISLEDKYFTLMGY